MELLVIIAFIYAIHSAVEDTKAALRKSRGAYVKSADLRFPKAGRSRRVVHAARHDAGFWFGQAAQGFPAARHGLAAGWHAGRKAQAEGRAQREKAKAEHLEARVQLIPEVRRHLERQRAALEQIRAQREEQEGSGEDGPQSVTAPPRRVPGVVGWRGPARMNGESAASPGEGRETAGEGSPSGPAPSPEAPAQAEGSDRTYSYGPADATTAWPAANAENAHLGARYWGTADKPWVVTGHPAGGGPGTTVATYADGREVPGDDVAPDPGGPQEESEGSGEGTAAPETEPPASPAQGEPTVSGAADTTYDGVLRSMTAAKADAEVKAAEAGQASKNADSLADAMQGLEVDTGTLSAMADHQAAHDEVVKAHQKLSESAEAVEAALKRGHAGLAEAHQNAPVQAATREFYQD